MKQQRPIRLEDEERIQAQIEDLRRQHVKAMRGRLIASPAAIRLQQEILRKQMELEALRQQATELARLKAMPIEDTLKVVMIPLLADVMNAVIADVEGLLRAAGLQETVFGDLARRIKSDSLRMVDTLAVEDGLPMLLDVDDQLIGAVYKKMMSFLKQRMNVTK